MPNAIRNFLAGHFLSVQPDGMNDELWAKRKLMTDRVVQQAREEGRLLEATRIGREEFYQTVHSPPPVRPSLQSPWPSAGSPAPSATNIAQAENALMLRLNQEEASPKTPPPAPRVYDRGSYFPAPGHGAAAPEQDTEEEAQSSTEPSRNPSPVSSATAEAGDYIQGREYPQFQPDSPLYEDEATDTVAKEQLTPQTPRLPPTKRTIRGQDINSLPPWRLERSPGQTEPQGWDGKGKGKAPAWL